MRGNSCKRLRRTAALLGALLITTASPVQTAAQSEEEQPNVYRYFPEDASGHWAENIIYDLVHAEVVTGYEDPASDQVTVRPNAPITRAEFVTLLVKALNLQAAAPGRSFADVRKGDWYEPFISTASGLNLITGATPAAFEPNRGITREEIAALLARAFDATLPQTGAPKMFVDIGGWSKPSIDRISAAGIISGYEGGTFRPATRATRAESMVMLHKALLAEHSAAPSAPEIQDTVIRDLTETARTLSLKDFPAFYAFHEGNAVGYYKVMIDSLGRLLEQAVAGGATIDFHLTGTPSATVVTLADRFAVAELHGAAYTITATSGDKSQTQTQEASATFYLKRTQDGTWKIYSTQPLPG